VELTRRPCGKVAVWVLALGLGLTARPGARAVETPIDCRVLHETAEGLYVDAGADSGLSKGAAAWLEHHDRRVARVEVVSVAAGTAFIRLTSERPSLLPGPGDPVTLVLDSVSLPETPAPKEPSPTLKDQTAGEPFVPLLVQPDLGQVALTEAENLFHGRLTVQQLYQAAGSSEQRFWTTRLRSSGTLERIDRTPWTLEWSGDLSYRDGGAFADSRLQGRFQGDVRLEAYRLSLFRRFDDRSFVRLGRFLPAELPAVGYLDGVHGEEALGENWRLGGLLGFKSTRDDLEPSIQEPAVAGYATYQAGTPGSLYYSGTGGFLFSLFEGDADRLALLLDQRADVERFSVFLSSEVDFDIGAMEARSGTRLTRLDLFLDYEAADWLTLRAGADRYEVPDTAAERDLIAAGDLDVAEFFAADFWRFSLGASADLGWRLRLSADASYTESDPHDGVYWSARLTRTGLGCFPDGTLTLAAYNLDGIAAEGYGARLSAYLPFLEQRLSLLPAVDVRFGRFETTGENFFDEVSDDVALLDVSLRAQWAASKAWSFSGGVSYAITSEEDRVLVDVAVTYRW
jgi:hypothetical protein